jgi:predicted AAA+ superfamily ATPase
MINHISNISKGALFEQNIFQNLRMQGDVNYYQRKSGPEIDFIFNKKKSFEVKVNPSKTDLNKLAKISKELNIDFFRIISMNYSSLKNVVYGFEMS